VRQRPHWTASSHRSREFRLIQSRTAYSPIPIRINEKLLPPASFTGLRASGWTMARLNRPFDLARQLGRPNLLATRYYDADYALWTRYLQPRTDSGDLLCAKFARLLDKGGVLKIEKPRPGRNVDIWEYFEDWREGVRAFPPNSQGRFLAVMSLRLGLRKLADLHFISDGVLIARKRVNLNMPGIHVVVCTSGMTLDVDEQSVVENTTYLDLLHFIEVHAVKMAHSIREGLAEGHEDANIAEAFRRSQPEPRNLRKWSKKRSDQQMENIETNDQTSPGASLAGVPRASGSAL
jgi:hypothetical protein